MKAIQVSQFGVPSELKLVETDVLRPAANQLLIKIHAAGVNFVDIYQRRGEYKLPLPYIPGLEASGEVVEVGNEVSDFTTGDRVCYTGHLGSYSEYTTIDANKVIPLDRGTSFINGAAFPLQGMTAHYLIHDYHQIQPGDFVLIQAAAGGVGLLLVQWAKHLGARVIGTVSTPEKERIAHEAGADHVILYSKQNFAPEVNRLTGGKGAVLIIDGVGKSTFPGDLEAASVGGHIVLFGSASGPTDPISPNILMPRSIHLSGGMLANATANRNELLRRSSDVIAAIKSGWLKLRVGQVFPLSEANRAHEMLENRRSTGKLILSVID